MGKEDIQLSVLVAVYNAEKYLDECIRSLLCQSIEKMQIIIVDDGSEDSSLDIMEKYGKKYKNIKIIAKKHEGTLLTRLEGMHYAQGKYIAFADSDDTYEPFSLRTVLDIAMEKNVDILEYGYHLLNSDGREIHNRNMGHNRMPTYKLIKGRKCFDLLDSYNLEVCLHKRLYSKKLCRMVLDYFTNFADHKSRFKNMLVEDEFMTPLFFANAGSYYCIEQKIYNYKFRNPGGTTSDMAINSACMLKGAEEYMCACAYISVEIRKKKLVDTLKYFDYKRKGIDFYIAKSKLCKMPSMKRIKKIMQYYSVSDIILIYICKIYGELRNVV